MLSDDETDSTVPKIISSVDPKEKANVRSILKGSPQKIGQESKPKKSLRVANAALNESQNNR